MNIALVNNAFDHFFGVEPGESELQEPTSEEKQIWREAVDEFKRKLRDATPVEVWHPTKPGHDDL